MKEEDLIKIVIADDHQIVIDGLKSLLVNQQRIKVIGEAINGLDVLEIIKSQNVDIVVLDIEMPKMGGLETTKYIREHHPNIKVLILSMHGEEHFVKNIVEAGAVGYILKNRGKEELVKAIHKVSEGGQYLGEEVTDILMASLRKPKKEKIHLTRREIQVLKLIALDHTTSEISVKLHIADSTVETHRRNLIEKTGVKSSIGLARFAVENNYLS